MYSEFHRYAKIKIKLDQNKQTKNLNNVTVTLSYYNSLGGSQNDFHVLLGVDLKLQIAMMYRKKSKEVC